MNISTYLKSFVCFCFITILSVSAVGQQPAVYKNGVLQSEFKVKLKREVSLPSAGLKSTTVNGYSTVGLTGVDKLNFQYEAVSFERLIPYSAKFNDRHQKHGLHLWYKVTINSDANIADVIKAYGGASEIQLAEPFYKKSLIPHNITPVTEEMAAKLKDRSSESPFDDPRFGEQWHYHNTEDNPGTPGADINLLRAWEMEVGDPDVIVAVIDQGVDYQHEDLAANMWINEAELNGTPGEDSDGNGYIDDIYGFNFVSMTGDIERLEHGTHVAGTVAATNNNGVGVSGVAGGSGNGDGVRIMSCMIMSNNANGDAAAAFVYAADNGAVIAQNSWGYNTPDVYEQSELDAIDYFIEEAGQHRGSPMKGGVVVFAAGNNGEEGNYWPGCYEPVIAVVATDPNNKVSSYSNFGEWVDVSAPGGEVSSGENHAVLSTMPDDTYAFYDGTSMACPHVSGVAALIASHFKGGDFNSEELKSRLLAATHVIDTMTVNKGYEGKIGLGAIDAWEALQSDNGIAPDKITDLSIEGISSDFVKLHWTVPADEDDEKPRFFHIYYSTVPFDGSDVSNAERIRVDNYFEAGEAFDYHLNNLKQYATYYLGVAGVDRWGNEAELSDVLDFKTNKGGVASVDKDKFTFTIDVNDTKKYADQFTLTNSGEGLLKYQITPRHVKNIDFTDPTEGNFYKVYNKVDRFTEVEGERIEYNSVSTFEQVESDKSMYYFDDDLISETAVRIGERESSMPNSIAIKFTIDDEEGFNLGAIDLGLVIESDVLEPMYVEIFKGDDLHTAKLIHRQSHMISAEGFEFDIIALKQQLFFNDGESFFAVCHLPPNLTYPLVIAEAVNHEDNEYCYYSSDQGATWQKLQDVYFDYTKVFAVLALERLEALDNYVTLSNTEGYLQPNESQQVDFTVDAEKLINGDYTTNLQIIGEGSEDYFNNVELEFGVRGQKYKIESDDLLDFGNVFIGENLRGSIVIHNNGLGVFRVEDLHVSDSDYRLIGSVPNLPAERSFKLDFNFVPTKEGPINAKITLEESNGDTYEFALYGVGVKPAKAVLSPETKSFTDLDLSTTFTDHFYLHNDGEFPLRYYISKFANGSNMPDYDESMVHNFGYVGGKVEPVADEDVLDWVDISLTGTDISDVFRMDGSAVFKDVLMGFSFPYYGNNYDTCYITGHGAVSLKENGWFNAIPAGYKNEAQPHKLISAWGMPFLWSKGGKILYQQFPGKFIIQYDKVLNGTYIWDPESDRGFSWTEEEITFQIVLFQNGDVEFLYKDLGKVIDDESIGFNRAYALIMMEDQDEEDRLVLNGYGTLEDEPRIYNVRPATGHKIYFKSPGLGAVNSVTNPFGTVHVGDSIKIEYEVSTDSLYVGDFTERINVISNDPINSPSNHTIELNITSGGEVDYIISVDELDFGDVFQGGTYTQVINLGNEGRALGKLSSMVFQNELFEVDGFMPLELHPGTFADYTITVKAENMGAMNDVLIFTDEDGITAELNVSCRVIEAPYIGSDKEEIVEEVDFGQTKSVPFTVNNTGLSPMKVSPNANEWMSVVLAGQEGHGDSFDYIYSVDKDDNEYYNPTDVVETGEKLEMPDDPFDPDNFWVKVAMPDEVNYYGVKTDTIFVGHTGVITFIDGQEGMVNGPDYYIPNENGLNGFLAPLFGFNGLANPELYPLTGVYTKAYNDKFVVRFQDIASNGGGKPVSVEVWMYWNGIIKYMYDIEALGDSEFIFEGSIVGLENHDGTEGLQVSTRTTAIIDDKTVITFYPKETFEIEAQSSKAFDVVLNSNSLFGGEFKTDLIFENNTPSNPEMTIPVTMNVIGQDSIVVQDTLDLGEVYIVDHNNDGYTSPYKRFDYEFTISNEGSRPLFIRNLTMQTGFATGIIMGDDEKFGNGNSDDGWFDISRTYIYHTLKPNESETFNLRVTPMAEGDIVDSIRVICDVEEGEIKIPVSATFIMPALIDIHSEGIHIYANSTNDTDQKSFSISNKGKADLQYEMEILFERNSDGASSFNSYRVEETAVVNSSAKLEVQKNSNVNTFADSYIDRDEYNRILEYENNESSDGSLGYGGAFPFYAATGFTAPESGFNLSHVMLWYSWGDVLESEIEVQILGGSDDFYKAEVLHTQVYHHNTDESSVLGEYITIELEELQFFYPYEKFYVMFKFDEEVQYPMGSSTTTSAVTGRFFYGDGTYFFDTVVQGMGNVSWMVKAAEEEAGDNFWATSDTESTGVLEAGESTSFDIDFRAIFAAQGINYGAVTFHSNDPYQVPAKLPITLTRNKGPQYEDGNVVNHTMDEMEVWEYTFKAFDEEGDDFTLELKEEVDYLTCEIEGDQIHILFEPDYDGEGVHSFEILGEDSWGNKTSCQIMVTVNNVNRAPIEENIIGTQYFELENTDGYVFNLEQYIIDPDGDAIEFEVSHSHPDVMEMLPTGSTLVFLPTSIGYSEVSITATDEHGAVLETGFDVFVEHRVGIDDNWESTINIYPNPVQDVLYLDYQGINAERYEIIDASGSILKNGKLFHGGNEQISVTNLMSGIYILKIYTDQGVAIKKFTKQ